MAVSPVLNHDSLRRREAEYLAGAKIYVSGSDVGYPTQSAFPTQSASSYNPYAAPTFLPPRETATTPASMTTKETQPVYNAVADSTSTSPVLFTGLALRLRPNIVISLLFAVIATYIAVWP